MSWPWPALVVSGVVTMVLTPLVRRAMLFAGVVDVPNHRSSHALMTPRGGGLACAIGLVAGSISEALLGARAVPVVALVAAFVLAAVGLVDDRRGLRPVPRLLAQIGVGVAFGACVSGPLGGLVGAVVFPVLVNVVNFMDGINGITSVTVIVWAICAVGVGLEADNMTLTVLGLSTAGAGLGFLPANVAGRLFLGDVGSYLFGSLVAGGILLGALQSGTGALLLPLSVYLADVLSTLFRRARRRAPLAEAHREHVYQRMANDIGLGHERVSLIVGIFTLLICAAALWAPTWLAVAITVCVSGLYLALPSLFSRRGRHSKAAATRERGNIPLSVESASTRLDHG